MKAPVLFETLCVQLREAKLTAWIGPVTTLYHTTYREAYAAGKGDCEERWADQQEEEADDDRRR
ncbi:MAG: hypothetical protein EBS05_25140 [Proteobacteria bacterium]|jgi:hypothetical protein|nr:hypothetical protein [Pseudomonadota bacterium]